MPEELTSHRCVSGKPKHAQAKRRSHASAQPNAVPTVPLMPQRILARQTGWHFRPTLETLPALQGFVSGHWLAVVVALWIFVSIFVCTTAYEPLPLHGITARHGVFVDDGASKAGKAGRVPAVPSVVRPRFVQNHIYQQELDWPNTSCEACRMDEELRHFGWDPRRYPWRMVLQAAARKGNGTAYPEVLFGTALAQRAIWEHQHPKNCSNATFIQYFHLGGGIGSQLHLLGQALALAMHFGRVLVLPPADPAMRLIDPTFCPGAHGFQCWLQNLTHCQPTGDVMSIFKVPGVPGFSHQSVPEVFRSLLASSPIKKTFWFYWWRAQSVTYLVRFNKRTRDALDSLRSETLFSCESPARMPVLEAGTISVHVRHGRKWSEASMCNFTEYKGMLDHLADDSQDLRVLYAEVAESNATFSYPAEAYSDRKAFISTEDPRVVDEALKLCSAEPRWKVFYTKVNRSNDDSWTNIRSFEHARREILIGFMNLELALEADAWVCTLSSNWCRLIDELRMTIARKAAHPYLSLSKGMKEPCRPAEPHCYLNF